MTYNEVILVIVNNNEGISHRHLKVRTMGFINPSVFSGDIFDLTIASLIHEGSIIPLIITIEGIKRVLYFPKGTIVEGQVTECNRNDGNNNGL
jgi:hypothetical protein